MMGMKVEGKCFCVKQSKLSWVAPRVLSQSPPEQIASFMHLNEIFFLYEGGGKGKNNRRRKNGMKLVKRHIVHSIA